MFHVADVIKYYKQLTIEIVGNAEKEEYQGTKKLVGLKGQKCWV